MLNFLGGRSVRDQNMRNVEGATSIVDAPAPVYVEFVDEFSGMKCVHLRLDTWVVGVEK